MVDTRPELPPDGAHHPPFPQSASSNSTGRPAVVVSFAGRTFLGVQNDTDTQLVRKSQNSKSYERTRQPVENKGQEVLKPVNLLKAGLLAALSRQAIENKPVNSKERTIKHVDPVNLLKLKIFGSVNPVKSLKVKALISAEGSHVGSFGAELCRELPRHDTSFS